MATHGNDLVREARKRARLTQRELAERAGTTQSAIARLESGRTRPAFDEVLRLVRLCGMDLDIMLAERDGSDWAQASRQLHLAPGARAERMVAFGHEVRTWMPSRARDAWPTLEPEPILRALVGDGVEFVVIGGIASAAYGSILPTYDIDLVPEPGERNLGQLAETLVRLHAVAKTHEPRTGTETWQTDHGVIEVHLCPAGTGGHSDLVREARAVHMFGCDVLLASLGDVIRIKQAANAPMDQRVLPVLREILANRDLDAK